MASAHTIKREMRFPGCPMSESDPCRAWVIRAPPSGGVGGGGEGSMPAPAMDQDKACEQQAPRAVRNEDLFIFSEHI